MNNVFVNPEFGQFPVGRKREQRQGASFRCTSIQKKYGIVESGQFKQVERPVRHRKRFTVARQATAITLHARVDFTPQIMAKDLAVTCMKNDRFLVQ